MESHETLCFASKQECILVFLATGNKTRIGADIQGAFAAWQKLSDDKKLGIGRHMKELSNPNQNQLYEALVSSFNFWEELQDLEGAPGWLINEASVAEVIKYMGSDLIKLLSAMDEAWQKTLKDGRDSVKKVGSLLELPELTSDEKYWTGISQESFKDQDQIEEAWTSVRKDRISDENYEKIRGLIKRGFCQDSYRKNDKNNVPKNYNSKEILDNPFEPLLGKQSLSVSPTLEEEDHFRNLLIYERFDDSDFEKQISPMSIDNEQD